MTVRTIELPDASPLSCGWQRRFNSLEEVTEPRLPEPVQLYALAVLVLVLHEPDPTGDGCESCGHRWPCERVKLAFRLREGF
jgi:hypothetical protein